MRLINTKTGQYTKIKNNEFGWPDYESAVNRLAARVMRGHFAASIAHYNLENRPERTEIETEIEVEIIRGVGNMTEHTGHKMILKIA